MDPPRVGRGLLMGLSCYTCNGCTSTALPLLHPVASSLSLPTGKRKGRANTTVVLLATQHVPHARLLFVAMISAWLRSQRMVSSVHLLRVRRSQTPQFVYEAALTRLPPDKGSCSHYRGPCRAPHTAPKLYKPGLHLHCISSC